MAKENPKKASANSKTAATKQARKPAKPKVSESSTEATQSGKAWAKRVLEKAITNVIGRLVAEGLVQSGHWLIEHVAKALNDSSFFWSDATTPQSVLKAAATQDRLIYLQQLYLDVAVLLATHQRQLSKHASRLPELEQQLSANLDIYIKVRTPNESERIKHKTTAVLLFEIWAEGLKPMAPARIRRI